MSQLGELLERFRHTATPGPPAAAGGVPGDVAADLEAELRPLLAALDEVEDEARALVAEATIEAAALRQRGIHDAEGIVDAARTEALRVRAAPIAPTEDDDETRAIAAAALMEADGIRRRARGRIPAVVARILACMRDGVRQEAAGEAGDVVRVGRG